MRAMLAARILAIIAVAIVAGSICQKALAGILIQGDRSDRVAVQADDVLLSDVISALGDKFGFEIVGSVEISSKVNGKWTGPLPMVLERLLRNEGNVIIHTTAEHDVARVIITGVTSRVGGVASTGTTPAAPIESPARLGLGSVHQREIAAPAAIGSSPLLLNSGGGASPASRIAEASTAMSKSFDVGGDTKSLAVKRVEGADATTIAALNAAAVQRLERLVNGLITTCVGTCRD
jgi:hypothetical protein